MSSKTTYLQLLKEAIQIPSISTDPKHRPDIRKMAVWCKNQLDGMGFVTKIIEGYGNPVVFGKLQLSNEYPTVMHYGHYDVQPAPTRIHSKSESEPAEKKDGWDTDPFQLAQKDGRIFARGAIDNKGQFIIYMAAIKHLLAENRLKHNVLFIIEGDEETGSGQLPQFLKDYLPELKADFALISDGERINNQPTLDVSYRGTINAALTIKGPKTDLHSGLYGGLVENPINTLSEVITSLAQIDFGGKKPTDTDQENLKANSFNKKEFEEITGRKAPFTNASENYQTLGFSNTVQVTGINGGYNQTGFKNAIPTQASAKINIRFNPALTPREVSEKLNNHVAEFLKSKNVDFELSIEDKSFGIKIETEGPVFDKVKKLLSEIYGSEIFYNYCGATLPVAHDIVNTIKIPAIFVGLGNADCNMHAPNENFKLDLIEKGLKFAEKFLENPRDAIH